MLQYVVRQGGEEDWQVIDSTLPDGDNLIYDGNTSSQAQAIVDVLNDPEGWVLAVRSGDGAKTSASCYLVKEVARLRAALQEIIDLADYHLRMCVLPDGEGFSNWVLRHVENTLRAWEGQAAVLLETKGE